jgi:hypothetical protein
MKDAIMIKFILVGSAALTLVAATPALAQGRQDQNGSSTFDSNDPTRTDPGAVRRDDIHKPYGKHSGANGASSGERGTFDSGPNDPPPPFTPQREGGR